MGLSAPGTGDGAITSGSVSTPVSGSISFWIRPSTVSGNHRCLGAGDAFELRVNGSTFYDEYGKAGAPGIAVTLSAGTLYHYVATWETVTTETGQVYLNGVFQSSTTGFNDLTNSAMEFFSRNGSSDNFDGDLHDVRIYNRVLPVAEILTIYHSRGKDSIVHGMINRWMMDEGVDGSTLTGLGTVKDRGANQNNANADTGPPDYVYDANITPRRRAS